MNIINSILKRKSVRAYQDKQIGSKDLAQVIEAGQWAPNAGDFRISVVRNAQLRQQINDLTKNAMLDSDNTRLQQRASLPGYQPLYGAPVLILLSGPKEADYSAINTALAAENMLLAASGLGLGACFLVSPRWALNVEQNRELAREVLIPDDYQLMCAVILGYAADDDPFTAGQRQRKGSVVSVD